MSLSQIVWFRWKSVAGDTQYWQAVAVSIQKCYITVQSHEIITQKVSFVVVWHFCGFNSPNQYQMQAIDRFSRMDKKLTSQLTLDHLQSFLLMKIDIIVPRSCILSPGPESNWVLWSYYQHLNILFFRHNKIAGRSSNWQNDNILL